MKKLVNFNFDPYITPAGRVLAICLIAAGGLFYWKFGIGPTAEEKTTAFIFGAIPIIYGILLALTSLKPDRAKRNKQLGGLIRIPLFFIGASLAAALVVAALK